MTVTPVTTTGGSTPRRTLTDDDRRRLCEHHESHPGVKQTEIGGTSPTLYPPPILQLCGRSMPVERQVSSCPSPQAGLLELACSQAYSDPIPAKNALYVTSTSPFHNL
jgi:hypothetical protein